MTRRSLLSLPLLATPLLAKDDDWLKRVGARSQTDSSGQVTSLNLRGSWVDDSDMFVVADFPHLRYLNLAHTRITDEGLLRLKRLQLVEELDLEYVELITDSGLMCVRDWKNLTRLNLRGTRAGNGTLEVVGKLEQLKALDLSDTDVTDVGFDYLITLTNLEELGLPGSRVNTIGISCLRLLTTLKRLDLSGQVTSRRGARTAPIAAGLVDVIAGLTALETLELGRLSVTSEAVQRLSVLPSVKQLGLAGCELVDDEALDALSNWPSLERLDLQNTSVTVEGVARLRAARPDLRLLANAGTPRPKPEEPTREGQ